MGIRIEELRIGNYINIDNIETKEKILFKIETGCQIDNLKNIL
jgi:hypothetical protein